MAAPISLIDVINRFIAADTITLPVFNNAAKRLQMELVKGPFSQLHGDWLFHTVGDGSQRACKVELSLRYGFDSLALAAVVGPIFDKIASTMMDAFIERAEKVYG